MSDDSLALDTLLGELRHRNRRQILTFFDRSERDTAHIDELIEHLDTRNDETDDRARLVFVLHHKALPALAAAGFLEYDPGAHTARYRENPHVERALNLVDEMKGGIS